MRHLSFLLCAAVLGLVGCGGDDDVGPGSEMEADAAAGSGADAGGEPGDGSGEPAGGDGSDVGCESSNTIDDVAYAIACTNGGSCECLLDGEVVDTCKEDPPTCSTIINGDQFTVGCCEFELP
jgi:hypothetical protein